MTIILADSGGSKTDWLVLKEGSPIRRWRTTGLNPNLIGQQALSESLKFNVAPVLSDFNPEALYFFGAGLGAQQTREYMKHALQLNLALSCPVRVETDLMAAALAGLQGESGTVGLIGTGSVAFVYDGQAIRHRRGGWGYLLGDEGGGIDLGRAFLRALLDRHMPDHLVQAYARFSGMESSDLVERLYLDDHPARFMAAQVPFLVEHSDDPFVSSLVAKRLKFFLSEYLEPLIVTKDQPVVFLGGIARAFDTLLIEQCNQRGMNHTTVIDVPIIDRLATCARQKNHLMPTD